VRDDVRGSLNQLWPLTGWLGNGRALRVRASNPTAVARDAKRQRVLEHVTRTVAVLAVACDALARPHGVAYERAAWT
jgi:hypothetical protein